MSERLTVTCYLLQVENGLSLLTSFIRLRVLQVNLATAPSNVVESFFKALRTKNKFSFR